MKHKIMAAIRLDEADRQLNGRVEMDDAYLGGERRDGNSEHTVFQTGPQTGRSPASASGR